MFVYFLWSAAFACAVKMRAHSAFRDCGTGVIVSPDERRSVCNFGSVFGSLWVQVWSRFSVNKPRVTFLAHWSGMFMFWVFLNIYFKAGQNVFSILCTEFRSYKLVFHFSLTRSPQSLPREWTQKVCSDNECSASHSIVYKHHALAHITYLRLSSVAQKYFLVFKKD